MAPAHPRVVQWHLRLLGPAAWRAGEGAWRPLQKKDAALFARLATLGPQGRESASAAMWPDVPLRRAAANLRQRLYRLRQEAGGDLIVAGEQLSLAENTVVDLHQDDGEGPGGGLLPSMDFRDEPPALHQWVEQARQHWLRHLVDRRLERAAHSAALGALDEAIREVEQAVTLAPLSEHAWRRLMQLHATRGDRASAIASFERCEQVLRVELGVRPGPETLALLAQVEHSGPPAAVDPLPASLLRPPQTVGRSLERLRMQAAWQAGQAFVLLGAAGLGKSRLLMDHRLESPATVAIAAARPGDDGLPYAAVVRVLRSVVACPGLQLPVPSPELARLMPEWGRCPAGPGHDSVISAALDEWLDGVVAGGLQGVLVDDLQHADLASLQVFRRWMARDLPRLGFATREGPAPLGPWLATALTDSRRAVPLPLQPLDDGALDTLVRSLGLVQADPSRLARELAPHWNGNPLYALEILKDGLLRDGLEGPLRIPASVEVLLERRIAQLGAPARRLAGVAALAGADFSAELAAQVLACPLLELAAPWSELEAAQVLRGAQIAHESLLDAILGGVPEALRRPLHGRIAACLERLGAPAERIARHHARAEAWAAAAEHGLRAAQDAERLGRRDTELAHVRQAADAFERAGQPRQALDVRLRAVQLIAMAEGIGPARDWVEGLAGAAAALAAEGPLHMERCGVALWSGAVAEALGHAGRAIAHADPCSDLHLRAQVAMAVAEAMSGRAAAAGERIEPLAARFDGVSDPRLACELWGHLGVVRHLTGRVRLAAQAAERQIAIAQDLGHLAEALEAQCQLVSQYTHLGRGTKALALARRVRAQDALLADNLASRVNDLNMHGLLNGMGRYADALDVLQGTLDYALATAPASLLRHAAEEQLAETWLALNCPDLAEAEVMRLPEADCLPQRRAPRLALLARIRHLQSRPEDAGILAEQAMAGLDGPHPLTATQRQRVLLSVSPFLPAIAPGGPTPQASMQSSILASLQTVLNDARQSEFAALELLARVRLAQASLRLGEPLAAAEQARQALERLGQDGGHIAVNPLEVWAVAVQALEAAARTAEAEAARAHAHACLGETIWPQVPPAHRARFVAHPLLVPLGLRAWETALQSRRSEA